MTSDERFSHLKCLLRETGESKDVELRTYLDLARHEILGWMYSAVGAIPDTVTDVPQKYEVTQIMACVSGYGISGAEGQTGHSENGISRTFKYADMVDYIRAHVMPIAGVV
jgi:hypothetical protein